MLNEIIKVDLHIHSHASQYKDGDIVKNSTTENLRELFAALEENGINLFSITDHNRFDFDLYMEARKIIESDDFPCIQELLAGVEFDVCLETGKERCHIIAIFNVRDWSIDAKRIENKIATEQLENADEFYTRGRFEKLLQSIGLDVILIAHQRKAISNPQGGKTSLSESISDPYGLLQVGYIDALEYQKPSVEGMLQNELKDFEEDFRPTLITGSDCHDWSVYPRHNGSIAQDPETFFSEIKCLPTFRGLLLGITSPKTRLRRIHNQENNNHIQKVSISGKDVLFSPGINVVIGENGSGKSTLLEIFAQQSPKRKRHVARIREANKISFSPARNIARSDYVPQAHIVESIHKDTLFEKEDQTLYKEVDHTAFDRGMTGYADDLKNYFSTNISFVEKTADLENASFEIQPDLIYALRFPQLECPDAFTKGKNPHEVRLKSLQNIAELLREELTVAYYDSQEQGELEEILNAVERIAESVGTRREKDNNIARIKNLIRSTVDEYSRGLAAKVTTVDAKSKNYKEQLSAVRQRVIGAVIAANEKVDFPSRPSDDFSGTSANDRNGFVFTQVAWYSNGDVFRKFYENMFVSAYQDEDSLKSIKNLEDIRRAVRNVGSDSSNWEQQWQKNLDAFKLQCKETKKSIQEIKASDNVGNTLGELSLAYYKYRTYNAGNLDLIIVDQPEDNISNKRILDQLVDYFGNLRDKVQVVFVTHNPLLVVNLDADNVIFLENDDGLITATWGCLEDEESGILSLVAEHMDGGKEAVEKRLKVYGKNN